MSIDLCAGKLRLTAAQSEYCGDDRTYGNDGYQFFGNPGSYEYARGETNATVMEGAGMVYSLVQPDPVHHIDARARREFLLEDGEHVYFFITDPSESQIGRQVTRVGEDGETFRTMIVEEVTGTERSNLYKRKR